jgi:lysophospholipase L1-like esterase
MSTKRGCVGVLGLMAALLVAAAVIGFAQARRSHSGEPVYVALGSSYAAGAGLGDLQGGSPWLCARSTGGYPPRLARALEFPLVDMSCGGAVTGHLLRGGQFFQEAQLRTINRRTRLVTITIGGNDIGYVGDLSMLAARRSEGALGWAARQLWSGPAKARNFAMLQIDLSALLQAVRRRAPNARVVVATYPRILPPQGTCGRIRLSAAEAKLMRKVGDGLAAVTRAAARQGGAMLVDMHALGAEHHACSAEPWVNGWTKLMKAPFHPNTAGAQATADAIARALR